MGARGKYADAAPCQAGCEGAGHNGGRVAAMSLCASCGAVRCVLIVLRSPRGEYQLCSECYLPGKPVVKIETKKKGKR